MKSICALSFCFFTMVSLMFAFVVSLIIFFLFFPPFYSSLFCKLVCSQNGSLDSVVSIVSG